MDATVTNYRTSTSYKYLIPNFMPAAYLTQTVFETSTFFPISTESTKGPLKYLQKIGS